MIVLEQTDGYRCITQPDHAHLAGELMALWRAGGLPGNPRRQDLLHAIREHDNGWQETDAAPHLDPERQRPHDFISLPLEERLAVWPRAVDRYAERRPYSALLILQHGWELYRDHSGHHHRDHREKTDSDPSAQKLSQKLFDELFEALEARKERLMGSLTESAVDAEGTEDPENSDAAQERLERHLEHDYPFLAFADLASLAVGNGWTEPFERELPDGPVRGRFDPGTSTLHLEPFPLAGATTFRVPCRHLPRRTYTGDADLAVELAMARWEEVRVRVAPEAA